MKMNIYVIYDVLAENSTMLFEQPNDASAVRSLGPLTQKGPALDFSTFELRHIGVFDLENATIEPVSRVIGLLSDLLFTVQPVKE